MQFRVENRERHDQFKLPEAVPRSYVRLHHGTTVPEDHDHVFVALVPPGTAGEAHLEMRELQEVTDPAELPAQFPAVGQAGTSSTWAARPTRCTSTWPSSRS
ncbi:hypothetical protein [Amycolatopsis methanolica]|uniref:Multicopper oxidase type 2 n=1 Tax=Amycolatopsis methanolica 239 TaxID=1068978 RepID=A0A076MIA5_AMYME|nr:hypothetical protein [Amycolatopsis methanolica]AIJ20474.1 multicopper oxidase type 2 [Amycolatopsis methanolica 239]